jgi:hypothetical protein
MTRRERAEFILADILPESQWPAVATEWIKESYEDTPDGEKRALNDLIHIAQRALRQPTKLSEVRAVLRGAKPEE